MPTEQPSNARLHLAKPRAYDDSLSPGADVSNNQVTEDAESEAVPVTRSHSSSSSLDPYYFGLQSPSDSPLPPSSSLLYPTTPDMSSAPSEPITPGKDPATIDRRGLVGVGELATPRWSRTTYDTTHVLDPDQEEQYDQSKDSPDSPWTIEAMDGEEISERENVLRSASPSRPLSKKSSMAEESGGEEILYPRQPHHPELPPPSSSSEYLISSAGVASPPSSFSSSRKARKRSSDEFERDSAGSLTSKRPSVINKEDKPSTRKHRSLILASSSHPGSSTRDKGRDRRRESAGVDIYAASRVVGSPRISEKSSKEHHARRASSSSSSSPADAVHPRRTHGADFSHLPPSPSTTSIQHILRQSGSNIAITSPAFASASGESLHQQTLPSPNVAHSLLRGTQEGWSGMDDEATAAALRKLDGLSGKTARARASISSISSRAASPNHRSSSGLQWEGIESVKKPRRHHDGGDISDSRDSDRANRSNVLSSVDALSPTIAAEDARTSTRFGDEDINNGPAETAFKKPGSSNTRLSFTPKRTSASSTTYTASTPTTSSRDSTSLSTATSLTSVSAASGRLSSNRSKRSSAGSDTSSIHSSEGLALRDRVASLASGSDEAEETTVPPVPPLPKDFSTFKAPPTSASTSSLAFPSLKSEETPPSSVSVDSSNRPSSTEAPPRLMTTAPSTPSTPSRQKPDQNQSASLRGDVSGSSSHKTPSKKWSFSNALNIRLSGSPALSNRKSLISQSPRSSVTQQLRKSTSKEQPLSPSSVQSVWSPIQADAMSSAASLASLSSVGSAHMPASPGMVSSRSPDTDTKRETTDLRGQYSLTSNGPLSPTSLSHKGQASKRLTPSSIPFFRRSSSQSMQIPSHSGNLSALPSPTSSADKLTSGSAVPPDENSYSGYPSSVSTSGTGRKASVLSLGLPSLLKGSSSRRSLHSDGAKDIREVLKSKEAKDVDRHNRLEKHHSKIEDKDRSESRISALMGRKRGKTLSSADPAKLKPPTNLPPMQMSALTPVTAQRVASLKSSSSTPSTPSSSSGSVKSSSRLTSQTVSSMQKQSDPSLRSRNQLPTIAGSPSVGATSHIPLKEPPQAALVGSLTSYPKETPTKIPRISSRTSTAPSPTVKASMTASAIQRGRMSAVGNTPSSSNPSPSTIISANEFGVMNEDSTPKATAVTSRASVRASPSSIARVSSTRQVSAPAPSSGSMLRKSNRDSMSFPTPRKSSASSINGVSTESHRFSALSPSKGLKLLSPKISLSSSSRVSASTSAQNARQSTSSPSTSQHTLSTPSPVPSIDDEEAQGDKEMMNYIRRQQARKLAAGATQEELDEMLRFPEPVPPGTPLSPEEVLSGSQTQYLSDYEREEMHDYPAIYYFGAKSKKKRARPDVPTNNFGYDDERGDYLVVNRDHLAYRYEIVDTLGKGSFGQVLHCRDHCTGESTAIKIIRNKKRFHHQALVEIKILDNLRTWDAEEKHHVIRMTDHFYFRNHLCIAMELLSINLYELIKANGFVGFTTALIRRFTSQMLMSLSLMRHHRVVHCDLKPENVLLKHPAKSALKVIDFGSSCFEHEKIYTYIQSRFYRSPEVILGMNYHMAIDMWSLGCILAELYTGFPIFPGENEQEQLSCIMEVLGVPDKDFINKSSRKRLFFEPNGVPRAVVNSKGRRRRPGTKTLAQVLRCSDEDFVDFIAKCLCWDPERRIKPQAALRHPFVTNGKQGRQSSTTSKSLLSSSSLGGSKSKLMPETPKKSQIGAPTPLTARSSRMTGSSVPTTPGTAHSSTVPSSSRSYRSSQSHGLSYSSRVGLATSAK